MLYCGLCEQIFTARVNDWTMIMVQKIVGTMYLIHWIKSTDS